MGTDKGTNQKYYTHTLLEAMGAVPSVRVKPAQMGVGWMGWDGLKHGMCHAIVVTERVHSRG